jgi:hypothetical protein
MLKVTCFNTKSVTTNSRSLGVRKLQCQSSSKWNNDSVIGEHGHVFSYVFLELRHFSSGLMIWWCLKCNSEGPSMPCTVLCLFTW